MLSVFELYRRWVPLLYHKEPTRSVRLTVYLQRYITKYVLGLMLNKSSSQRTDYCLTLPIYLVYTIVLCSCVYS